MPCPALLFPRSCPLPSALATRPAAPPRRTSPPQLGRFSGRQLVDPSARSTLVLALARVPGCRSVGGELTVPAARGRPARRDHLDHHAAGAVGAESRRVYQGQSGSALLVAVALGLAAPRAVGRHRVSLRALMGIFSSPSILMSCSAGRPRLVR